MKFTKNYFKNFEKITDINNITEISNLVLALKKGYKVTIYDIMYYKNNLLPEDNPN